MSVHSVFYPGVFTDKEIADFMKSPLWSLAAGAHFNLDGKLFLTQVGIDRCVMADVNGFPILRIRSATGSANFQFHVNNQPRTHVMFSDSLCVADSPNKRYLISRLADKRSGQRKPTMREAIMSVITSMDTSGYRVVLKEMVEALGDKLHPVIPDTAYEINRKAQEWALLLAYGHKQMVEVPSDVRPMLDKACQMHLEKHTRFDTFIAAATEFLDRDKWVVTYVPSYGYLCGKYNGKELVSFCKTYAVERWLATFSATKHMTCVEQPRFYRDTASMPESIRRELLAALSLAKTNRSEGLVKSYVDPDKLIPDNGDTKLLLQERIGALSLREVNLTWVMVDA